MPSSTSQPTPGDPSMWGGLLVAWLGFLAGVVIPLAAMFLITERQVDTCVAQNRDWCSVGYLYLIPVLFAGLLVIGPLACVAALRGAGQPRAGGTGWRCTVVVIGLLAVSLLVNLVLSAIPGYLSSPLVLFIWAPLLGIVAAPLIARGWALVGLPVEGPSVGSGPRGSTWETMPAPVDEGPRDPGW